MADEQVEQILVLVAERRGIDFRDYRRETLQRRARSRARAAGCRDLAAYRRMLDEDRDELDRLVETLVVPVTGFFRDAWAFRELADRVLPHLAARHPLLRAWVTGAASGEEAYTLAMLLAEASARQAGGGFEVIASDIDRPSLEIARAGVYPRQSVEGVPADLRVRYLRTDGSHVRVADWAHRRMRLAAMGTSMNRVSRTSPGASSNASHFSAVGTGGSGIHSHSPVRSCVWKRR